MKKEASATEIESLHQFCIKHFVKHYDVRIELVDHLASSIEKMWETDANITFEKALEKVYSTYGKLGFRKLMKDKELAVEKSSNKGILRALKSFLGWPQMMLIVTMIVIYVHFFSFYKINDTLTPTKFSICMLILAFVSYLTSSLNYYFKRKSLAKPLLSTSVYFDYFLLFILDYTIISKTWNWMFENFNLSELFSPGKYIFNATICILAILINVSKLKYVNETFKKAKASYPMAFK